MKFIITGNPVSSKNSIRSGITKQGRNYTYTKKNIKDYKDNGLKELLIQKKEYNDNFNTAGICPEYGDEFPIETLCEVTFTFYVKDNRNYDMINLMQLPQDLLKQAGILADDNYKIIYSVDGSRVYIDKDNPRTEITIKIKENL
jgi:Holliday junction resolvase RusA-like endonuclease